MRALKKTILIKMDIRQKLRHSLGNGKVLEVQKGYNFNLREDRCSFGYVVNGNGMKKDTPVLCHHLSSEPSYLVENEVILTDQEKKKGFKVFSIPLDMCFCFMENGEWQPCKDFLITQRIYLPYKGEMVGIDNQLVKNRMFVLKGKDEFDEIDLSGKCVVSLDNCDYEIIFYTEDQKEHRLIRTRGREVIGIDEWMTKEIKKGKYLIGLNSLNCTKLNNAPCQ